MSNRVSLIPRPARVTLRGVLVRAPRRERATKADRLVPWAEVEWGRGGFRIVEPRADGRGRIVVLQIDDYRERRLAPRLWRRAARHEIQSEGFAAHTDLTQEWRELRQMLWAMSVGGLVLVALTVALPWLGAGSVLGVVLPSGVLGVMIVPVAWSVLSLGAFSSGRIVAASVSKERLEFHRADGSVRGCSWDDVRTMSLSERLIHNRVWELGMRDGTRLRVLGQGRLHVWLLDRLARVNPRGAKQWSKRGRRLLIRLAAVWVGGGVLGAVLLAVLQARGLLPPVGGVPVWARVLGVWLMLPVVGIAAVVVPVVLSAWFNPGRGGRWRTVEVCVGRLRGLL